MAGGGRSTRRLSPEQVAAAQVTAKAAWGSALAALDDAVTVGRHADTVELLALGCVVKALEPLSIEARERAVRYLVSRYLPVPTITEE